MNDNRSTHLQQTFGLAEGNAPKKSWGKRGFTSLYQHIADIVDIIYPDDVMADLFDMSIDGVSTARVAAREDGYTIERVSPKKVGCTHTNRAWWHVTGRPAQQTDPVKTDPRMELLTKMFPGRTEEQIAALLSVVGD